jgi:hypothetical protein
VYFNLCSKGNNANCQYPKVRFVYEYIMADHKLDSINSATVLVANNGEPCKITCICCAELELELERTRIELRSTQKIVKLLREEIYSTELEVMNNTISGSVSPHEGFNWIQEQRI